jgi:cytoskeletal protein CcmA (bactofilin family)
MFFKKKNHTPLSTLPERFDTIIGQSTKVNGDMSSAGSMRVDGRVKGNIHVMETDDELALVIGAGAHVEGDVTAYRVVIAGSVVGNVFAANQVEIYSTAEIRGNVQYASIAIEHGAQVQGKLIQVDVSPNRSTMSMSKLIANLSSDSPNSPADHDKAQPSDKELKEGKEAKVVKKKADLLF